MGKKGQNGYIGQFAPAQLDKWVAGKYKNGGHQYPHSWSGGYDPRDSRNDAEDRAVDTVYLAIFNAVNCTK